MQTFIIAVLTADGLMAEDTDQKSTDWTSKEDRHFFRDRTKEAGVIVLGYNTYKTIGRPLPDRLNVVYSKESIAFPAGSDPAGQLEVTQKDPAELLKELEQRGFREVAISGGTTIFTMFMQAGLVDKIYLSIEPVIFGSGMTLFNKKFDPRKLNLTSMKKLGENTVLLEYDVLK